MEHKFILSCCSTADVPYDHVARRQISVLHYTYVVDGTEYEDDMGRDGASLPRFYEWIRQGKQPSTSQVSVGRYIEYFTELLELLRFIVAENAPALSDDIMYMTTTKWIIPKLC